MLLIGKRAVVLEKLAAALRQIGIKATITRDVSGFGAAVLRTFSAVAFGRAVTDEQRAAVRAAFAAAGTEVSYVDGLAPITPLLVAQTLTETFSQPVVLGSLTRGVEWSTCLRVRRRVGGECAVAVTRSWLGWRGVNGGTGLA